jgi:hypothetical protein
MQAPIGMRQKNEAAPHIQAGWAWLRRRVLPGLDPRQEREAREAMLEIRESLAGVGSATEGAFIAAGDRLTQLNSEAGAVEKQTAALAGLLSTNDGPAAALDQVLSAACQHQQSEDLERPLAALQAGARGIQKAVHAVDPIVSSFDVLGMMTRIESAHLAAGGGSFESLSETVAGLSRQVRSRLGEIQESMETLSGTVTRAASGMKRVSHARENLLKPLAGRIRNELRALGEQREQATAAAARITERSREIARATGDVVAALQTHDIVRQQVEHVIDALGEPGASSAALAATARLQAAQLTNSMATLERPAAEIRGALERIEACVTRMAEDAACLMGGDGETESLASLQEGIASIAEVLETGAATAGQLTGAATEVVPRLAALSEVTQGVETVGFEMQRVALNAAIEAARLGGRGAALEVAAQAIQGLARATEGASSDLQQRLSDVRQAAEALAIAAQADQTAKQLAAEARRGQEQMRATCLQAHSAYGSIAERTGVLRRQVRGTIEEFGGQEESLGILSEAAAGLLRLCPGGLDDGAAGTAGTRRLYTMESERSVHRATLAGAEEVASVPASPAGVEENVEFF